MTYLVFRKTAPSGFFQKLFFLLTKYRLLTKYPHCGFVIDGVLYHSTLMGGVHKMPFPNVGWDIFKVNAQKQLIIYRFEEVEGSSYDWFSLLGFVLPFRISVRRKLYCYELVMFLLTGEKPIQRVTAEDLLSKVYVYEQG